jgi:3-oxoacyl-[acyl-carrier protein] reductase
LLLNGKVGLISGSTKGIGLAIAKEFAERNGSTVIICSRSDDRSNRVAALLNGKTDIAIDVTSNASIVKSMTRLLVAHEHIDILVNDAGFPFERKIWYKSFDEISTADLKAILEVGAIGSVRLAKAVVRSMLANHHGGVIVNISRTLAISGHFEGAPYTMTKATIVTLTKHIVREHGRRNIQAYTLMLGNIATEATYKFMTEEERLRGAQEAAMKRWGEQDEIAKVAACVASENFCLATGNIITTDGGAVMS